jgi:hypothetical protein
MRLAVARKPIILTASFVAAAFMLWVIVVDIRYWSTPRNYNPNLIHVTEATYGESCLHFVPAGGHTNPVKMGNATVVASQSCDNTDVFCPIYIDHVKLGDPAVGCDKDFAVSWRCGTSQTVHRNRLAAEAIGQVTWIGCPAPEP